MRDFAVRLITIKSNIRILLALWVVASFGLGTWGNFGTAHAANCPPGTCCKDETAQGAPEACAGNPINLISGNKYQMEVDMPALPGVMGLALVRHYNSENSRVLPPGKNRNANVGVLGRGWRLNYDRQILWQGDGTRSGDLITLIEGDGRRLLFARSLRNALLFEGIDAAMGQVIRVRPPTERSRLPAHTGWHYEWASRGGVGGGLREHFDANGWMVARMAPTGEVLTIKRNTVGWPLRVTDPQGREMVFHYMPNQERATNRTLPADKQRFSGVQRIDTPVGSFTYSYGGVEATGTAVSSIDLAANLRSVEKPGKVTRRYHHEDPRWPTLLTGISVQSGQQTERVSTYLYDSQARAVLSVRGHPARLERGTNGQPIQPARLASGTGIDQVFISWPRPKEVELINALGQTTVYRLVTIADQLRVVESRGPGCPTCSPGNTRYTYDQRGQVLELTRITPQGEPITGLRWQYDDSGRVLAERSVRYTRGQAKGRITEQTTEVAHYAYAYRRDKDQQGRPILSSVAPQIITRPSVVPGKQQEVHVAYNDFGQPLSVTQKGWSPAVASGESPQPIERTTAYRYALINGRSVLVEVDGPLPGTADSIRYEWDVRGSHVQVIKAPLGLAHRFERDAAGRLAQEVPSDGVPITHGYLPTGEHTLWQRAQARATVVYDAQARPIRIALPDGEVQTFAYEGRTGAVASARQDGAMRWVVPPTPQAQAQAQRLEPKLPDPWQGQEAWVDDFGQLVALQTRDTGLETRQYDAKGRIVLRKLADGTVWRWQRDALGRIVKHEASLPGQSPVVTTLAYEGVNLVRVSNPQETETLAYDALGRVASRTVARPATPTQAAQRWQEAFEYDQADRLTRHELPEGGALHYTWGAGRQLQRVDMDDGRWRAVVGEHLAQWLGEGRHTIIEPLATLPATPSTVQAQLEAERGYQWGNGVALRWHLNAQGQLQAMSYSAALRQVAWWQPLLDALPMSQAQANAGPAPTDAPELASALWLQWQYTYDAWGRMQSKADQHYAYDTLGRLLVAQQGQGNAVQHADFYAYQQGRMAVSREQGQDHDWRPMRIARNASGLPKTIAQDGQVRTLRYSADHRLVEVSQGGQLLARYTHNTHGQRIGKQLPSGQTRTYLWSQGQLAAEGHANRIERRYVYAHGVPVAVVDHPGGTFAQSQAQGMWSSMATWAQAAWNLASTPAPQTTYLHGNELGTPVAATNAKGQVVWQAEHTAFGALRTAHRPGHAPQAGVKGFELNLRLPGQYFDEETGWHDNVLRTYDPQRGEYLEPDPLGPAPNWRNNAGPGLTQPFAYANHNPIMYADPSGLILFAFDGTGNDDNTNDPAMAGSGLSNVVAFRDMYDSGRARYVSGVGTVHEDVKYGNIVPATYAKNTKLDWLTPDTPLFYNDMGGNYSGPARIERMVKYFRDEAQLFDKTKTMRVDIIGFSRGAAEARDFANRIVQASTKENGTTYYHYIDSNGKAGKQAVNFCFMGLWDTVLSTNEPNYTYQLGIPDAFKYVAQAVALNEYRSGGVPGAWGATVDAGTATGVLSAWNLRNHQPYNQHMGGFPLESIAASTLNVKEGNVRIERGFIGAHADIGGGYPDSEDQLSAVSLSWMVAQAEIAGVNFKMSLLPSISNSTAVLHDQSNAIRVGNPAKNPDIPLLGLDASVEDRAVNGAISMFGTTTQRTMSFLEPGGSKSMTNADTHQFINYTDRNEYNWLTHPLSDPVPPPGLDIVAQAAWLIKHTAYEKFAQNGDGVDPTTLVNKTGTVKMADYMKWLRDKGYCFAGDACAKPTQP